MPRAKRILEQSRGMDGRALDTLRGLYEKHHWQVAGPTFYQLHLLFDKHYDEQSELVD